MTASGFSPILGMAAGIHGSGASTSAHSVGRTGSSTTGALTIMAIAEEMKRAAQAPGLDPSLKQLLTAASEILGQEVRDDPWVAIVRHELESVALMIEAEATVWPEEFDRLQSLAARVRARMP